MNRKAILSTAVCFWSPEDKCFVVESPLTSITAGADSEDEAMQNFRDHVDDYFDDWVAGKLSKHASVGRPAKGIINFTLRVKPEVRDEIATIAEEFDISQGEAVHFLLLKFKAQANPVSAITIYDKEDRTAPKRKKQ